MPTVKLDNDRFRYVTQEMLEIEKIKDRLDRIENALPVVRCKDCKWKQGSECVRFADVRPFPDDYCSRGERKETEDE